MVVLGVEPGSTHYVRYKNQSDESNSLYNNFPKIFFILFYLLLFFINNFQNIYSRHFVLLSNSCLKTRISNSKKENRNLKGNRNNWNEIPWRFLKYSSSYGGHKYFSTSSCCFFPSSLNKNRSQRQNRDAIEWTSTSN